MPDFSDEAVLDAWHANAAPWANAVRCKRIASRERVTNAAIVNAILQRKPRTLLDIGCGEGWLVRAISATGINCTGIDAVSHLIDDASCGGGGRFLRMDYRELAAGALRQTFDIAVCNFSLIGDAATEAVIAAAPLLLNRGGALIVQTLHPVTSSGDAPYQDGWREGSWAGIEGNFSAPAPWYFRTLQGWTDLVSRNHMMVERMIEPLHPDTGLPASVIFVCSPSGGRTMNHEQRMRDYYKTYNSENSSALRAFYADDVVLVSSQGETHGPDAIIGVYEYLISQFVDQMTPTSITINDDTAVVDITDRFTARADVADFMGVALKAGESFELKLRGTYTIVDGKFRHFVIEQRV